MAVTAALPSTPNRSNPPIHTPSYPYHGSSSPAPPSPSPSSRHPHSRSSTHSNSAPSTTPSSIVAFPSPSRPSPSTPNAHPYAIKTTSTALLSRSNSSAAQSANAVHRYLPPASPSPISPSSGAYGAEDGESGSDSKKSTGSMGMGRKGRHRYSRSLTDGPMPVPIPPGVTNNASSPYTEYQGSPSSSHRIRERARSLVSEPDEETPRRNLEGKSDMGPPATPLHRYSRSEPLSQAGNIDFNSRRSLGNDDEEGDNLNSDGVTLRRTARMVKPRTRSRNSSLSSNSSASSAASGRVREMVDELERSSATRELEEEGTASSRSGSPTKSSFKAPSSPSKHTATRVLPHRPSVNDLFSGHYMNDAGSANNSSTPGLFTDKEVVAKEEDETITHVAKKNVLGREPRMLPFPPTATPMNMPGVLSPLHTGAGSPFMVTNEQQYLQQQYHGPVDYELGFRHAASPHSQTFVVRHGPSPSNLISPNATGNNSSGKPARLLPYPPVTSETSLHHPRPRRAVGVSDRDADADDTSTTEGEGAYVTALESQTSSADTESSPASDVSSAINGADEATELSMAELLAAAPDTSQTISGAEAWEIELGDTVKRVGEVLGHGHPPGSAKKKAKVSSSFKEIGRKAGRAGTAEKAHAAGTGRDKESLRRPGIMGLFNDMEGNEQKRGSEERRDAEERAREFEEKTREVEERKRELEVQAEEIAGRSKDLDEKARIVDEVRDEVEGMGREVEERAKDIETRMKTIEEDQLALDLRERFLVSREEAVSRREKSVDEEEEKTQAREADLDLKAQRAEDLEAALRVREEALEQRIKAVALREEAVWNKEESITEREKLLHHAEEKFIASKAQFHEREQWLETAERDLTARELRLQEMLDREKEKEARAATAAEERAKVHVLKAEKELSSIGANVLRRCWGTFVLPVVGEARTPAFLRSPAPSTSTSPKTVASSSRTEDADIATTDAADQPRHKTPTWTIRRDAFMGRLMGGPGGLTDGYLVLMGIGMCVAVLRVLGRRGWFMRR